MENQQKDTVGLQPTEPPNTLYQKPTNHARRMPIEQNKREQFIIRRIGGTTYKVRVVFNESDGETMEDKILRIVRNDIATMEAGLKKLEAQEQKYSAELDKVLTEYAELKAQTTDFDPVELCKVRNAIRPAQEKAAEKQLEDTTQEKLSLIMLLSAKQETSRLLGEDTEERQARQLIAHKRQEQHRNSISKRKRSDPER